MQYPNFMFQCPIDVAIADGQQCSQGYCLHGRCPSHNSQCQQYWDLESSTADARCYEMNNVVGSMSGHCGIDETGRHIECSTK